MRSIKCATLPSSPVLRLTEETYIALLQNTISLDDFPPNDLLPLFNRLIADERKDIARDLLNRFDPNLLRRLVCANLSEDTLLIVSQRLKTLVLAIDFLDWSELSSVILITLVRFGLPSVANDTAVQGRLVDFVLKRFPIDPSFVFVLPFIDFSQLSHHQITSLSQLIPLTDETFGCTNVCMFTDSLVEVDHSLTDFKNVFWRTKEWRWSGDVFCCGGRTCSSR
jgi:hypothetical protein